MEECSSSALEENPVQDTWADLLFESYRIKSTNDFEVNFIWTCLNSQIYSEHSVSFWICLCDVFLKMRLSWVQIHFFGYVRYIDSESSLPSARNTSVMIRNLSVNRQVQFSLLENQSGSNFCPHCGSMQFVCFRTKWGASHISHFACSQPIR